MYYCCEVRSWHDSFNLPLCWVINEDFSSLKFPFMYSDMQVHKHSRLLTFSCDVPFKLGKITLTIKEREHKSSVRLSEMNSTLGFSDYLLKSSYGVLSDSTCRITWLVDILSQKKCMPPIVPQE